MYLWRNKMPKLLDWKAHLILIYELLFFFNDRFYLPFFVVMHGFRESDFDYY